MIAAPINTKQTREIKSFIYSHYFSDGLRITFGVLLPSLVFAQLGELATGITVSLGAVCVSIADNPGPVNHKRNGMLACILFISVIALVTSAMATSSLLIGIEILLACFFFSMFSLYGNRATSIGTATLLIMILSIDRPVPSIWEHFLQIMGGGIWYFLLSSSITQIRPYRLAQQELGECIKEVAKYVSLKANFYDPDSDFDENYKKLINQQVNVHTQQDVVRELLFKSQIMLKESTTTGRFLILVFVDMLDLFEQTMATHIDYKSIRNTYKGTRALKEFNKIIHKISEEMGHVGYHVLANNSPESKYDFKPDLEKLKSEIDRVETELGLNNLVLKKILINVRNMTNRLHKIYSYFNPTQLANAKIRSETDLLKFVSHQDFDLKIFKNNLNLKSSIFRHSVRVAIFCLIGYLTSKLFPLGHHSYWILLTIMVILKPGFSLTKERNLQRLIGTLSGGIAGACILIFINNETVLFLLMLIFMIGAYSFQRLNYVVSVLFMTPYILILFSFLGANTVNLAQERIIDTLIGSAIAFTASYLFLPSWEYKQLDKFMREVLIANYNYLLVAAQGMFENINDITAYKLARKNVYVSTANIGSAFQRMVSEPKNKQIRINEVQKFVVLNHILSSYIATLIFRISQNEVQEASKDTLRLVRRSLFTLAESINKVIVDDADEFQECEIHLDKTNMEAKIEKSYESNLLTEQLEFINKLTTDIQKICDKLSESDFN
ncbi:MAG: hypothetical protein JWN56_2110 [Sphingobacteriales bacterium]|nr:hypothetical protein [Sphingobacteriales bacterium]